jgi:hypothetical protein
MTRLLLLLPLLLVSLPACAPEVPASGAPPADSGDAYRRCGRPRCITVTETCEGGEGLVCRCTTVTCVDRCREVVVEGEPVCVRPQPIQLWREVPRG